MNVNQRRDLLITTDNPNRTLDYIVTIGSLKARDRVSLSLRYIPDKVILKADCFDAYAKAVFDHHDTLEAASTTILEDLNNELVARWLQVIAFEDKGEAAQHSVVLEDQQPQWQNPHLIARLTTI